VTRRTAAFLLAAGLLSCDNAPTAPVLAPELRPELHFYLSGDLSAGGIVGVVGQPIDPNYRLPVGTVIPVAITTSAGDAEELLLEYVYCHDRRKRIYECRQIEVTMHDGQDRGLAESAVRQHGGRWIGTDLAGRDLYYAFGDLNRILYYVRQVVTVRSAQFTYTTSAAAPFESLEDIYVGALRFDLGAPRAGNGIVTARPGETVRATYNQPDGSQRIWDYTLPLAP